MTRWVLASRTPASASLRMPLLCSSEYRYRFTGVSFGHFRDRRLQTQEVTNSAITSLGAYLYEIRQPDAVRLIAVRSNSSSGFLKIRRLGRRLILVTR
jgi:hypothetical protein